jgi:phage gp36-like protein
MAWLTLEHIEQRFGADALAQFEAGGADPAVAISDAEAECEGWISRAILLPVASPGPALLRIACDIARYNLWRRAISEDHPAYIAYRRALSDLQDAQAGRLMLSGLVGTDANATESKPVPSAWVVASSAKVFTDDKLGRMDSDLQSSPEWLLGGSRAS